MLTKNQKIQTYDFSAGLIYPLIVEGGKIKANASKAVPYGNKTVGYGRFYTAKTAGISIKYVIVCPIISALENAKYIEIKPFRSEEPEICKVSQIQVLEESRPPVLQITLEECTVKYDDQRNNP